MEGGRKPKTEKPIEVHSRPWVTPVKIVLSGSHGFIGTTLAPALAARGHQIVRLVRAREASSPEEIAWDPASGWIDAPALEGVDAVIHLAGESIAAGRWTAAKKARIRASRVAGTRLLVDSLARLGRKPRDLICASATGYYGHRGNEILVEDSAPGTGFLAGVCREWEAAATPARDAGIRVAHLRTAPVLSPTGGALARLLPIFRLGLGGRLGSGRQFMSWITLDDAIGAIMHVLTQDVRGPVNLASPHPVTNREFTATLGHVLRRPTPFAVPAGVLRLALGEVADELLGSQRVHPARLLATGYAFRHLELEQGVRHVLGSGAAGRPQT
jgi:uncharacterized protein